MVAQWIGRRHLAQQPPHLARDDDILALHRREPATEARLGKPVPVQRRRVEEPDPRFDRLDDGRARMVVGDRLVKPSDRRRPEAEPRHLEAPPAEWHSLAGVESHDQVRIGEMSCFIRARAARTRRPPVAPARAR